MSCASVWMSLVFCLFKEEKKKGSIVLKEGTPVESNTNNGKVEVHFLSNVLLLYQTLANRQPEEHRSVSRRGGTHFHSCSRSLMASFFRPYFSLKLAASLTRAKWAAEPGCEETERDGYTAEGVFRGPAPLRWDRARRQLAPGFKISFITLQCFRSTLPAALFRPQCAEMLQE